MLTDIQGHVGPTVRGLCLAGAGVGIMQGGGPKSPTPLLSGRCRLEGQVSGGGEARAVAGGDHEGGDGPQHDASRWRGRRGCGPRHGRTVGGAVRVRRSGHPLDSWSFGHAAIGRSPEVEGGTENRPFSPMLVVMPSRVFRKRCTRRRRSGPIRSRTTTPMMRRKAPRRRSLRGWRGVGAGSSSRARGDRPRGRACAGTPLR